MTLILLVRHASHNLLGRVLAGRMPGVSLNTQGQEEALALAERLSSCAIKALHSSPSTRALETAAAIAAHSTLDINVDPALDEIDFGAWTGRAFSELAGEEAWQLFNRARSVGAPPGGEGMPAVQMRVVAGLARISELHPGERVVAVSHGDVIKAALLHYLAAPLDMYHRLELSPASVSGVEIEQSRARVLCINCGDLWAALK